ncbi:hypothetical protein [Mycoplasmopsis columbinasalis]|uniref:hypothetical protein n=1 Tax=Mycoplasmopsis columbinasalis TaxID=114880 RepID=UPI001C66177F|nr:hypothetical protein [Mycoplasmopsis columbinasalis]
MNKVNKRKLKHFVLTPLCFTPLIATSCFSVREGAGAALAPRRSSDTISTSANTQNQPIVRQVTVQNQNFWIAQQDNYVLSPVWIEAAQHSSEELAQLIPRVTTITLTDNQLSTQALTPLFTLIETIWNQHGVNAQYRINFKSIVTNLEHVFNQHFTSEQKNEIKATVNFFRQGDNNEPNQNSEHAAENAAQNEPQTYCDTQAEDNPNEPTEAQFQDYYQSISFYLNLSAQNTLPDQVDNPSDVKNPFANEPLIKFFADMDFFDIVSQGFTGIATIEALSKIKQDFDKANPAAFAPYAVLKANHSNAYTLDDFDSNGTYRVNEQNIVTQFAKEQVLNAPFANSWSESDLFLATQTPQNALVNFNDEDGAKKQGWSIFYAQFLQCAIAQKWIALMQHILHQGTNYDLEDLRTDVHIKAKIEAYLDALLTFAQLNWTIGLMLSNETKPNLLLFPTSPQLAFAGTYAWVLDQIQEVALPLLYVLLNTQEEQNELKTKYHQTFFQDSQGLSLKRKYNIFNQALAQSDGLEITIANFDELTTQAESKVKTLLNSLAFH